MDYYHKIEDIRLYKHNDVEKERAIRLYCVSARQSWNLQIRAPLGVGNFGLKDGKDFIIATASLSLAELTDLGQMGKGNFETGSIYG